MFQTKNSSTQDRTSSIGTLGEVITGLKDGATPYTDALLHHLVRGFTDDETEVRSNAAFAVGALVENSQQDISSQYLNILISLRPYFEVAPGSDESLYIARDNAVGCVSRMILKNMSPPQIEQVSSDQSQRSRPSYTNTRTLLGHPNSSDRDTLGEGYCGECSVIQGDLLHVLHRPTARHPLP